MKTIVKTISIIILLCNITNLKTEKRKADDVFKKWLRIQCCMNDINIEDMNNNFGNLNIMTLKSRYVSTLNYIETFECFCDILQDDNLKDGLFELNIPQAPEVKTNFAKLYSLLQNDIPGFIDYLKKNNFAKELKNNTNIKIPTNKLIEETKTLLNLLFYNENQSQIEEFLIAVGNRFYEYCFGQKTNKEFEDMLKNEDDHPIVKFLYSSIWWTLAGNNWKHWHKNCLQNLKEKTDTGNEIVYIGGGNDIYQLIKTGIYNIRIIDPILPSQPRYYSESWDWLVVGGQRNADPKKDIPSNDCGIGDEIYFNFDKKLIMKREAFEEVHQIFQAKLATGEIITIPKSTTTWKLYEANNDGKILNQEPLGTFIIERRFTKQSDFKIRKNKTLLISFNELYFITAPISRNGWGINPFKFDDKLQIHVKQLRTPVSCRMTRNMHNASDQLDFNYIALGTCIN